MHWKFRKFIRGILQITFLIQLLSMNFMIQVSAMVSLVSGSKSLNLGKVLSHVIAIQIRETHKKLCPCAFDFLVCSIISRKFLRRVCPKQLLPNSISFHVIHTTSSFPSPTSSTSTSSTSHDHIIYIKYIDFNQLPLHLLHTHHVHHLNNLHDLHPLLRIMHTSSIYQFTTLDSSAV